MSASPPTKIKTYKNDIAPIGFLLDLFPNEVFEIPIFPIPLRIDKVSNGQATLFINLNRDQLNHKLSPLDLEFDLYIFYKFGLMNLIKYTKKKYNKITYRNLDKNNIINWFNKSKNIQTNIIDLEYDFTYIFAEFMVMYFKILNFNLNSNKKKQIELILRYFRKMKNYINERIKSNQIKIKVEDNIIIKKIYTERRNKYFPEIININIYEVEKDIFLKKKFTPFLIYEDLFETFSYNMKLLETKKDLIFKSLEILRNIGIFNKGSNINKNSISGINIEEIYEV